MTRCGLFARAQVKVHLRLAADDCQEELEGDAFGGQVTECALGICDRKPVFGSLFLGDINSHLVMDGVTDLVFEVVIHWWCSLCFRRR